MAKQESIGALWKNEKGYLTGTINGVKIIAFKNDYKQEGDKQPDFKVYVSKPKQAVTEEEGF